MLSFLLLLFLNAFNYLELGGNIGYGALWNERGVDGNIGITYIQSLKNCPIKIDYGIYGGTMKQIYDDWDEYYGIDFNLFCGIVLPLNKNWSIRFNLVWNPYLKGVSGKYLLDGNNADSTLLAIMGVDMNCVYRFNNGVYVGCSCALRKNLARDSFWGCKYHYQEHEWDNDLYNLNMIRLMLGYSLEFGEEKKVDEYKNAKEVWYR